MRRYALFRFYAELNDFLPPSRKFVSFAHPVELPAAVKDIIEAIGVPHPEVGLILLNTIPVDFSQLVRPDDRVSVFPDFRTFDTASLPQLRPPLPTIRLVLDAHLGRLATYLRMLGFDSAYRSDSEDKTLAQISHDEQRILLTRDCGLLKRSAVEYGYFVRATEPRRQIVEVVNRFTLSATALPFSRCLACNSRLQAVSKESVLHRLQPETRRHFNEFQLCPSCNRIYWAGSHFERMRRFIEQVICET